MIERVPQTSDRRTEFQSGAKIDDPSQSVRLVSPEKAKNLLGVFGGQLLGQFLENRPNRTRSQSRNPDDYSFESLWAQLFE